MRYMGTGKRICELCDIDRTRTPPELRGTLAVEFGCVVVRFEYSTSVARSRPNGVSRGAQRAGHAASRAWRAARGARPARPARGNVWDRLPLASLAWLRVDGSTVTLAQLGRNGVMSVQFDDEPTAQAWAERMRQKVAELAMPQEARVVVSSVVTASWDDVEELLDEAVELYGGLEEEGALE